MDGVLYMLQGHKHAAQLVVSLYSLRKHYDGPVHIAAGDETAWKTVQYLLAENSLAPLTISQWQAATRRTTGKTGAGYANKCRMYDLSPFEHTIFLDADTLIANPIDDLWTENDEVKLTWFADWVTTGAKIAGRIKGWRHICPDEYEYMSQHKCPAINTGVLGFSRQCGKFMQHWRETTEKNICFICDEIAAQLIFIRHPHCIMDDRWNFSPQYSSPTRNGQEKKIRIYHYHGKQHCKPSKSDGYKTWIPVYEECVREKIARIDEWTPAGDKRLKAFLEDARLCV